MGHIDRRAAGKLAHKLLDGGISELDLPLYLQRHYLLPPKQAQLLTEICLLQRTAAVGGGKAGWYLHRYSFLPYPLLLLLVSFGNSA